MKKLLAILLCFVLLIMSGCGATPKDGIGEPTSAPSVSGEPNVPTEPTDVCEYDVKANQIFVDVTVGEEGYYGMYADATLSYYEGELVGVAIENPALLFFQVSEHFDNGVYLLKLTEGDTIIENLAAVRDALLEKGDTANAEKITAVLDILNMSGPIISAST